MKYSQINHPKGWGFLRKPPLKSSDLMCGLAEKKPLKSLWADGYYVGSAGHVSQDSVKKYILEQQGKVIPEVEISFFRVFFRKRSSSDVVNN